MFGVNVVEENDFVFILMGIEGFYGVCIFLDVVFVGVMINIILVVVKVYGMIMIENVVKEFEIIDLVIFLNNMGVKIWGVGIDVI